MSDIFGRLAGAALQNMPGAPGAGAVNGPLAAILAQMPGGGVAADPGGMPKGAGGPGGAGAWRDGRAG